MSAVRAAHRAHDWLWWHLTLPWLSLRMQLDARHDLEGD